MTSMKAFRAATLTTLALIAGAAASCGGRTQGKPDSLGQVIGSDAGLPPEPKTNPGTSAPTVPSSTTTPRPSTGTGSPPTMGSTSTSTTGSSTSPDPTRVIVSPPHEMGCDPVEPEARPSFAYTFSDGVTGIDLTASDDGQMWCGEGTAGPAGPDYANWGAGLGLFLGSQTESGDEIAFDAAARGIVGVRFVIDLFGRPLRLMLSEVDSPDIVESGLNYEANPYSWGRPPNELQISGTYEVRFENFFLAPWTQLPDEHQRALDPSRLHSLQFLVPNDQNDPTDPYRFCVWGVQWVDTCGNPVEVSLQTSTPAVIPTPTTPDATTAPVVTYDPGDSTSVSPGASSEVVWPDSTSVPLATSDVVVVYDAGLEETAAEPPVPDAGEL